MTAPTTAGRPTEPTSTLLLDASNIRRLVTMKDVIEVVQQAVREQAAGGLVAAPRVALPGGTLLMAAESQERRGVATKLVSVAPGNRASGLSTIQGLASWLDYASRRPLLVADATAVTALRTGALSGVATQALAPPEASVLAMVGTGGQAMSLLEACAAVRPIQQVHLASLHRASAEELHGKLCALRPELDVRICQSVKEAVKDASIVCLATTSATALVEDSDVRSDVHINKIGLLTFALGLSLTSATALVEDSDVRSDVHINAVGAYRPDMRELGVSVLAVATLVCSDDPHGALREAGDLMEAAACGALNAGSIIDLGRLDGRHDRARRSGITIFKSVGTATADLALLDLLWQRAKADGTIPSFEFSA